LGTTLINNQNLANALLGMPVVIGYTVFIHHIFKGKV